MLSVPAVRILVVDDDVDAAELLEELLQARHYEVECAARVEQIRERLKSSSYDVIISDIRLGTWSGLELPALLGEAGVARPLMIALTGDSGAKAKERSLAAGFDSHFSKPFELEQLEAQIRSVRLPRGTRQSDLL
jgi:DNA-binding response OmpR family regulator